MSTLDGVIQTAKALISLFGFIDGLVIAIIFVYRFARRVRGGLAEPVLNTLFVKYFALWTLVIMIIPALVASALAVMLFFWTESAVASLAFFALWVVLALFIWLMPWVVPSLDETVREYLKKRYG